MVVLALLQALLGAAADCRHCLLQVASPSSDGQVLLGIVPELLQACLLTCPRPPQVRRSLPAALLGIAGAPTGQPGARLRLCGGTAGQEQ